MLQFVHLTGSDAGKDSQTRKKVRSQAMRDFRRRQREEREAAAATRTSTYGSSKHLSIPRQRTRASSTPPIHTLVETGIKRRPRTKSQRSNRSPGGSPRSEPSFDCQLPEFTSLLASSSTIPTVQFNAQPQIPETSQLPLMPTSEQSPGLQHTWPYDGSAYLEEQYTSAPDATSIYPTTIEHLYYTFEEDPFSSSIQDSQGEDWAPGYSPQGPPWTPSDQLPIFTTMA